MFSYMDYPPFYIIYLCVLALNLTLCILYYFKHSKNTKISKLHPIIRVFLISSIVIWVLDSIPYLYLPMEAFSGANFILSNIFAGFIGITAVYYEMTNPQNIRLRKIVKGKNSTK